MPPYLSSFPDVRAATPVTMASASIDDRHAVAAADPVFRSLFQAGERTQPVSPAVQELWGNSSSLTSVAHRPTPVASAAAATSTPAASAGAPQPLDLFSDRNGTFSS